MTILFSEGGKAIRKSFASGRSPVLSRSGWSGMQDGSIESIDFSSFLGVETTHNCFLPNCPRLKSPLCALELRSINQMIVGSESRVFLLSIPIFSFIFPQSPFKIADQTLKSPSLVMSCKDFPWHEGLQFWLATCCRKGVSDIWAFLELGLWTVYSTPRNPKKHGILPIYTFFFLLSFF